MRRSLSLIVLCILSCSFSFAQDQEDTDIVISDKLIKSLGKKIKGINNSIDKQTQSLVSEVSKNEEKIRKKVAKKDSVSAAQLFDQQEKKYKSVIASFKSKPEQLKDKSPSEYIPGLDSLNSVFKFLSGNSELLKNISPDQLSKVNELKDKIKLLQGKLNVADQLKATVNQRREFLSERLAQFGVKKELDKISKKTYYYKEYLNDYKQLLNDPEELQKKLLAQLQKLPIFQKFVRENSFLAGLFASPAVPSNGQPIQGLQARFAVNQSLQQNVLASVAAPSQFMQQQFTAARQQMNTWKNKINSATGGSDGLDMPNFKPNSQKTKSFLKRLEYGGNIQLARVNNLLPTAADLALSVGYKINDKSTVGIGTSYKVGFGKSLNQIRLSHEGIGFRTFAEMKLKGKLFISGGYEQNYLASFKRLDQLRNYSAWQSGALMGLSKKYQVNKKVKGNMQLLYDFLHTTRIPKTQAILFRVGYTFK